jgi:hypothetical protein
MATLPLSCPQDAVPDVVASDDPPLQPPLPRRQLAVHQTVAEVNAGVEVKPFSSLAEAIKFVAKYEEDNKGTVL